MALHPPASIFAVQSLGQPLHFNDNAEPVPIEQWDREHSSLEDTQNSAPTAAIGLGPHKVLEVDVMSQFNHFCQRDGIIPEFDFLEISSGQFHGTVTFGDQYLNTSELSSSKKEAKSRLCKAALEQRLPEDAFSRSIGCLSGHKRVLSDEFSTSSIPPAKRVATGDYVSVLMQYTQKLRLPLPVYLLRQISTQSLQSRGQAPSDRGYICTVRVDFKRQGPQTFGSTTKHYTSKMEAKQAAAYEATMQLRAGPVGDRKSSHDNDIVTGDVERSTPQTGAVHATEATPADALNERAGPCSLSAQIVCLAESLGFSHPTYNTNYLATPICETYAAFLPADVAKEPRLAGELGNTGPVFGRKSAKEICCGQLLLLLQEIKSEREW